MNSKCKLCQLIPVRFRVSCVHDNTVKLTMGSVKEEGYKWCGRQQYKKQCWRYTSLSIPALYQFMLFALSLFFLCLFIYLFRIFNFLLFLLFAQTFCLKTMFSFFSFFLNSGIGKNVAVVNLYSFTKLFAY